MFDSPAMVAIALFVTFFVAFAAGVIFGVWWYRRMLIRM